MRGPAGQKERVIMPVSQPKIERTTPDFMGIGYGNLWSVLQASALAKICMNYRE